MIDHPYDDRSSIWMIYHPYGWSIIYMDDRSSIWMIYHPYGWSIIHMDDLSSIRMIDHPYGAAAAAAAAATIGVMYLKNKNFGEKWFWKMLLKFWKYMFFVFFNMRRMHDTKKQTLNLRSISMRNGFNLNFPSKYNTNPTKWQKNRIGKLFWTMKIFKN